MWWKKYEMALAELDPKSAEYLKNFEKENDELKKQPITGNQEQLPEYVQPGESGEPMQNGEEENQQRGAEIARINKGGLD